MLDGKVAIVTGAGHGIGRAHALELASHGAHVVVNDLGTDVGGRGTGRDADQTVALIEERGGKAVANYDDVSDEAQAEQLVSQAIDAFGALDVLVANAGILRDRMIWNMEPADFDAVLRVHVRGTWLPCHFAARHWRRLAKAGERVRGRIITTTSGAGLWGNIGQTNYATAKAAIVGMTLTMSVELASIGVTVNAVGPGGATRMSATIPGQGGAIEPDDIDPGEYHPMDPAAASPLVAWLASDESQMVTGQVLRAFGDKIHLMRGWHEAATISSDGARWDAASLGARIASDLFQTRSGGLPAY